MLFQSTLEAGGWIFIFFFCISVQYPPRRSRTGPRAVALFVHISHFLFRFPPDAMVPAVFQGFLTRLRTQSMLGYA